MGRRDFRGYNKRIVGKRCAICNKLITGRTQGFQLQLRTKETKGKDVAFCSKCHKKLLQGLAYEKN